MMDMIGELNWEGEEKGHGVCIGMVRVGSFLYYLI